MFVAVVQVGDMLVGVLEVVVTVEMRVRLSLRVARPVRMLMVRVVRV